MEVFKTYYHSPVGILRVSCTDKYITEVHFLNNPADIVYEIPGNAPAVLRQCIDELIAYFQGQLKAFTVPIQQEGTSFQQKVWGELLNIPYGKTISYMDMAKRLGDPKVIRAAASANGQNSIAIIVPCHRVIGANSSLVGYGGGLWRKKILLELEAKHTYGVQTLW
jgi:methylated-DNA-[protein]-cysteine S-methyltransferase